MHSERLVFQGDAWWVWSREGNHSRTRSEEGATYECRWFSKKFTADSSQAHFLCSITADSYYLLWFNGVLVSRGPGRGDSRNHFYDELDLSAHIACGENEIRVLVVDYSTVSTYPAMMGAPGAVMTYRGGLAVDAILIEGERSERIITDNTWQVCNSRSRKFVDSKGPFGGYVGYSEVFNAQDWETELEGQSELQWAPVSLLYPAKLIENYRDEAAPYQLRPSAQAPLLVYPPKRFNEAFSGCSDEVSETETVWCAGLDSLVVPARSTRTILLDAGALVTAYIQIYCKGLGGHLRITYAEALRQNERSEATLSLYPIVDVEGATGLDDEERASQNIWTYDQRGDCVGYSDEMLASESSVIFEPIHWRTFRYVKLTIVADADDLILEPLTYKICENAAQVEAHFRSDLPWLDEVWEKSVRTVRNCTHEIFEDCPYYEQLQYVGDSEIISKLHFYLTGDSRLTRQAIFHFDWSRLPEGITASRYPCRLFQVIPSWSLHWISMISDYYYLTADIDSLEQLLPGISQVLAWFRLLKDESGLPAKLPYWNFVDWTPGWDQGQPPGYDTGPTCVISCQYSNALKQAAELFDFVGDAEMSSRLNGEYDQISGAINRNFYSSKLGAYLDTPDQSGQPCPITNAWAVCAGVVEDAKFPMLREIISRGAPANTSFFGMYWLFRARRILAQGDWKQNLEVWKLMNDSGLTTWPEDVTFERSLCHGWSAHPIVECIEGIFGLRILEPGWKCIQLSPESHHPKDVSLSIPTQFGMINLSLSRNEEQVLFEVKHPREIRVEVKGGFIEGAITTAQGNRIDRVYHRNSDMSLDVDCRENQLTNNVVTQEAPCRANS